MSMERSHLWKVLPSFIFSLNQTRSTGYVVFWIYHLAETHGFNTFQVEQAVREIKRLLIEASAAALQAEMRNPSGTMGRYSVL